VPVLTDYDSLTMKFMKNEKVVQLKGHTKTNPSEATTNQFKQMTTTQSIEKIFHLQVLPLDPKSNKPLPYPEIITNLLWFVDTLFDSPNTFPPQRPIHHQIPLLQDANLEYETIQVPIFTKKDDGFRCDSMKQ